MKTKIKQVAQILFFFALGVGFIWWFVAKLSEQEISELFESIRRADYFWVIVAFLISIASCYVRAVRWKQLLKPIGYANVSISRAFLAIMSGYLTNLAIPRLGEVIRCACLRKSDAIPVEKTLGTVITERIIDLILFAIIFFVAAILEFSLIKDYIKTNLDATIWEKAKTLLLIVAILSALVIIFVLIARKKIRQTKFFIKLSSIFAGLWQGMKSIFHLQKPLLFIFYSFLIWFLWICGTWAVFKCVQSTSALGFTAALAVTVLSAFGPMVTPGGIGLYPAIFAQTLLLYGVVKPIGYAAGWLSWLVSQIASAVFGLAGFVYFSKNTNNIKNNTANDPLRETE
ncbi:MAG: flippase-like domain-containing protein [Bacteroidales bacterium]|nr:flippase-like domain-containing protein [Bacteroidales bacterium]